MKLTDQLQRIESRQRHFHNLKFSLEALHGYGDETNATIQALEWCNAHMKDLEEKSFELKKEIAIAKQKYQP